MKPRKTLIATLVFVALAWTLTLLVSAPPDEASARTYSSHPASATTTTTEESNKTYFAHYVAYTDNALTIAYDGVEDAAYIYVTTEVTIKGFAPTTSEADLNFPTITLDTATPTLYTVCNTISGYTGYTCALVDGIDILQTAYDLATAANTEVTTSGTFTYTAANNLGIMKVIAAAGTGKRNYLNSITVSGTGTGAIVVRVYDGLSTVKFYSVLASGTEKTFEFPSPIVGSANTQMLVRITGATTLTAGYINAIGYTR